MSGRGEIYMSTSHEKESTVLPIYLVPRTLI